MKLGQVLGQQPQLVGDEIAAALRELQDGGHPRSAQWVMRRLARVERFRGKLSDMTWVAGASTADVFMAAWGENRVAVKATRWTARLAYRFDHALMYGFARVLSGLSYLPFLRILRDLQVPAAIRNLADGYLDQLDLQNEAKHAEVLRRTFLPAFNTLATRKHRCLTVCIPEMHYSERDILVMQWAPGVSARTVLDQALARNTPSSDEAIKRYRSHAETIIEAAIYMTLRQDLGHGDLHAGNVRFDDDQIWLLDFGLVFEMCQVKRLRLCAAFLSIAASDAEGVARQFALVSPIPVRHDAQQHAAFVTSIATLIAKVQTTVGSGRNMIKGLPIGDLLKTMMSALRKHRVSFDPAFALVDENLIASQGFVGALATDYDLLGQIRNEIVAFYRSAVTSGGGHAARVLLLPSLIALAERQHNDDALQVLVSDVEHQFPLLPARATTALFDEVECEVGHLEAEDFKALHMALLRARRLGDSEVVRKALARQQAFAKQQLGELTVPDLLARIMREAAVVADVSASGRADQLAP